MEFLKSLFTKPLSFEEFSEAATKAGIKLADLAKGERLKMKIPRVYSTRGMRYD